MEIFGGRVKTPESDTGQVAVTMACALLFGIAAVLISLLGNGTIWRGLLWAGAWSSVGWFLGFLFGIPRFLSTDTARTPAATALESAKQELASATTAAKALREESAISLDAKATADRIASEMSDKANRAEQESAAAAAAAATNQQDAALKATADSAQGAAAAARQESEEAAAAAAKVASKAKSADEAAAHADSAVEVAKGKIVTASTNNAAAHGASLTVNTNLEQISDWLTKIIVGVSLVESQPLLVKMQGAAAFMARSMVRPSDLAGTAAIPPPVGAASDVASGAASAVASAASAATSGASAAARAVAVDRRRRSPALGSMESFAYAIMLYFLATGLLGSYLLTRLFLQRALANAARLDGP